MSGWWPVFVLLLLVASLLTAQRQSAFRALFRWLPVPLWCYALPMAAVAIGCLPVQHPGRPHYRQLSDQLLPLALALLLLEVDLTATLRAGRQALVAAVIGALGILIGTPLAVWALEDHLPPEAWKGAGALAGTWTGGTMNLLALRTVLGTPEPVFAPLIVVDALVAYGWMALLVAASGFQGSMNRWLRAGNGTQADSACEISHPETVDGLGALAGCAAIALGISLTARRLSTILPTSLIISSAHSWTVLLVTSFALGLSLIPGLRRLGRCGGTLGYPCLYLVLAATGAQADPGALWSTPAWIALGAGVMLLHGSLLLLGGRLLRIPLGILATASQANVGGVVSAPLVAAVYHQRLAPIGLLLAMLGNALGTYLGCLSATLCRWLTVG